MRELIAPTTDATTAFSIYAPMDRFIGLAQGGPSGSLGAGETISLEINLGGVWTPILPAIELTDATNYIQIAGPAKYRINKSPTAAAVGVYLEE